MFISNDIVSEYTELFFLLIVPPFKVYKAKPYNSIPQAANLKPKLVIT